MHSKHRSDSHPCDNPKNPSAGNRFFDKPRGQKQKPNLVTHFISPFKKRRAEVAIYTRNFRISVKRSDSVLLFERKPVGRQSISKNLKLRIRSTQFADHLKPTHHNTWSQLSGTPWQGTISRSILVKFSSYFLAAAAHPTISTGGKTNSQMPLKLLLILGTSANYKTMQSI